MLRLLQKKTHFKAYLKQMRWGCLPIMVAYGAAVFYNPSFIPWRGPSPVIKNTSVADSVHTSSSLTSSTEVTPCALPTGPQEKTLTVQEGDSFIKLLTQVGVAPEQGHAITSVLRSVTNPGKLTVGQEIQVQYTCENGVCSLQTLSFSPEMGTEIRVTSAADGVFKAEKVKYPLHSRQVAVEGTIQTSLYQDALRQGADPKIVHSIIRVLSHHFDLQRDLQKGDTFKVLYKLTWDEKLDAGKAETFLFISMTVGGKVHTFYQFKPPGSNSYAVFDAAGRNLKREFLRTPVDGARLSSPFGHRLHPILGFSKMHKGVDFAAPSGTPVMAAGDGVVVRASFYGAYGNYILIRHNAGYHTAYAHLRGYAPGIRSGTKVRQGQKIGYVGTTGRSTGPHLHFELLKAGQQINPKSIHKLPATALTGPALNVFRQYTQKMTQAYLVQLSHQKLRG